MNLNKNINTALVVGLGSIGRRHCTLLKDIRPDLKIIVLRHKKVQDYNFNNSLGIETFVYSMEEALRFNPDIAILANPSSLHIKTAIPLAKKGIHLFIEKPLSSNLLDIQKLLNISKLNNCKIMTAYNLRFLPSLQKLKEEVDKGKVGNILSVRSEVGQYLKDWRPDRKYESTVTAQKKLGGGVLLELSHEIDYLSWIFGDIEWVKAHFSKQSQLNIDVEDTAFVLLGFKKNQSEKSQLTASLNMDFIRHDHTRLCTVIGDQGTLRWDGILGKLEFYSSKKSSWDEVFSSPLDRNFSYREELVHFLYCVETNQRPKVSGEDGLYILKVVDAIRRSQQEGKISYLN